MTNDKTPETITLQIILVGSGKSGKTTLMERLKTIQSDNEFDFESKITEGFKDVQVSILKRNKCVSCRFRDVGGQDQFFVKMKDEIFEKAVVAIGVCSVDQPGSLLALERVYLPRLRNVNVCKIYIICNKYDLKDKYEENIQTLNKHFARINKNNDNMFDKLHFVSATTGENLLTILDDTIVEEAVANYIKNKQSILPSIEKRCQTLHTDVPGKMVVVWVEGNDCCRLCFNKKEKSNWKEEHFGGQETIYYTNFNGNEWYTEKFNSICHEIWSTGEFNNTKDDVVSKIYQELRNRKWHPAVLAFDVKKNMLWNRDTPKNGFFQPTN